MRKKGLNRNDMSNIIVDMTQRGASKEELERAIYQSQVIIDIENQGLWKKHKKTLIIGSAIIANIVLAGIIAYKIGDRDGFKNGFQYGFDHGLNNTIKLMDHIEQGAVDHQDLYNVYKAAHPGEFKDTIITVNRIIKTAKPL